MCNLIDVTEFLLQSSLKNRIEFYNWVILCISCNVIENVWWLSSILWINKYRNLRTQQMLVHSLVWTGFVGTLMTMTVNNYV
jgi:hypothetical protein